MSYDSDSDSIQEILNTPTDDLDVSRFYRSVPPADYLFKIQSYSLLLETPVKKYESDDFQAGGYTWKLILYPMGNLDSNGHGHVSLYLAIVDTEKLSPGWEVTVDYKLFVFDQKCNYYLIVQDVDGAVSTFSEKQTEYGFDQLISLKDLYKSSNGYRVNDLCVFGAEVFVIGNTKKSGTLSIVKETYELTLKLENFSTLNKSVSKSITVCDKEWNLKVYPKGINKEGIRGKYLSAILVVTDCETLPSNKTTVFASYTIKILDQLNQEDHEETLGTPEFSPSSTTYCGLTEFISLSELNDAENGYIKDDVIIIELQILNESMIKISS